MSESPVQVGTTAGGGCVVRLVGRATMHHSPAAEELVVQTLDRDPAATVALDLSDCSYLDSTFLGSLFGLYQRYRLAAPPPAAMSPGGSTPDGDRPAPRLTIHAPPATMKALFGPLKLDKVLKAEPAPAPTPAGEWVSLDAAPHDPRELTRHVMDCHRRLAAADTPASAMFTKIADAMQADLDRAG
ncbi:MAG: hypothetical protein JWO31_4155 [Phycisphaerales bacterium]|nr:hypothetical protein [Phycisphaerales bacterium]